ncbi:hypothetical protein [Marivita sp.]|uniref:hypothetical protein n=1 Tax=Marivita sp. TaxID=2003365 RepID=UPI003F7150EA
MLTDWPDRGYWQLDWNAQTYRWSQTARREARDIVQHPDLVAQWLQCEGTWFVGVDVLPSAPDGCVAGVPLCGPAAERIGARDDLHPAQVSITYPGYPRPRADESDAAFRYRRNRDAAHMDGVLAEGSPKRRFLRDRHDWILGLPLTETSPGASPLVVWEGSHHILQSAMINALGDIPDADWGSTDITEVYQDARKEVFATCRRTPLFTRPGEAVLLSPFLLHGVAPWQAAATASRDGRMVAYLRPESPAPGPIWIRQK